MTNRISYSPQDFQKMCEQADRDHESRKLKKLMERVKQQIAQRENPGLRLEPPRQPGPAVMEKMPSRPAPFDR